MEDTKAVKRTMKLVAGSFAAAAVVVVLVFASLDQGEAESPDLADGAGLAVAVLGTIGLLIALRWWSRAGEQPLTPAQLQMGFIVRTAIAELGLLVGILALFMTGSLLPAIIGLGLFLISLLLLVLALDRTSDV